MDQQNNEIYTYTPPAPEIPPNNYQVPTPNGMATAALVLGILSLVLSCCGLGIPLGALGILFALLSQGSVGRMCSRAKTGLGLSIGGLCLMLLLMIGAIAMNGVNSYVDQYDRYYEYYYPEQSEWNWDEDDLSDSYLLPGDQL